MRRLQAFVAMAVALSVSNRVLLAAEDTRDASQSRLERPDGGLWETTIGEGFRSSAQTAAIEFGALKGFAVLGARQQHDLALTTLSYGHMLGHTLGDGHFYKGNLELRGELFGGAEFSPSREWVIGLAPHLRYNLAHGIAVCAVH